MRPNEARKFHGHEDADGCEKCRKFRIPVRGVYHEGYTECNEFAARLSLRTRRPPRTHITNLKVVGGWKSDTIVRRYSKQGAARRGVESFRKNNPLSAI